MIPTEIMALAKALFHLEHGVHAPFGSLSDEDVTHYVNQAYLVSRSLEVEGYRVAEK